jgi:hypothetical protein
MSSKMMHEQRRISTKIENIKKNQIGKLKLKNIIAEQKNSLTGSKQT